MPDVPPNVALARQRVQTSDFYALCHLMLCQLAYEDEGSGQGAVEQIRKRLPTMPVPDADLNAQWTLNWGPAVTDDNSNLMYGALYSLAGIPVFSAVVIRGTDVESTPWGVVQQLFQDLEPFEQVAFPVGQATAKIAKGTSAGLQTLKTLTDPRTGQNIEAFVQKFVENNADVPIIVTGHSLGGCQTTVLAVDLSVQVGNARIIPVTFAAPTAGNSAFMQVYQQRFKFCPRWFNEIDLVPMAYAGVSGIAGLWPQCQRPAPTIVRILAAALSLLLKNLGYTQESPGNSRALKGLCQQNRALVLPPGIEALAVTKITETLMNAAPRLQARAQPFLGEAERLLRDIPWVGADAGLLSTKITEQFALDLADWVRELLFQHLILTGYWSVVKASNGVASITNPFDQAEAAAVGE